MSLSRRVAYNRRPFRRPFRPRKYQFRRVLRSTPYVRPAIVRRFKRRSAGKVHRQRKYISKGELYSPAKGCVSVKVNDLPLGNGEEDRHGNRQRMTYLRIKGVVDPRDGNRGQATLYKGELQHVYVWLVNDKRGDLSPPLWSDIWLGEEELAETWVPSWGVRDRYQILGKRVVNFRFETYKESEAPYVGFDKWKPYDLKFRLKDLEVHWDKSGKITQNCLYLVSACAKNVDMHMFNVGTLYYHNVE